MRDLEKHVAYLRTHVYDNKDSSDYILSNFGFLSNRYSKLFRGIYADIESLTSGKGLGRCFTTDKSIAERFAFKVRVVSSGDPFILEATEVMGVSIVHIANYLITEVKEYKDECFSQDGLRIAEDCLNILNEILLVSSVEKEVIIDGIAFKKDYKSDNSIYIHVDVR